jgi:hypothetical protein
MDTLPDEIWSLVFQRIDVVPVAISKRLESLRREEIERRVANTKRRVEYLREKTESERRAIPLSRVGSLVWAVTGDWRSTDEHSVRRALEAEELFLESFCDDRRVNLTTLTRVEPMFVKDETAAKGWVDFLYNKHRVERLDLIIDGLDLVDQWPPHHRFNLVVALADRLTLESSPTIHARIERETRRLIRELKKDDLRTASWIVGDPHLVETLVRSRLKRLEKILSQMDTRCESRCCVIL